MSPSEGLRVAIVSEHASPLTSLGGEDAGGQNVYVAEVSRNLARLGCRVDVLTRRDRPDVPEVVAYGPGTRVVHVPAGPAEPRPKDELWPLMPEFLRNASAFMQREGHNYDLLHGNFWMSGWVVAQLRSRLGIPAVQIFHAMGKTKQRHQGSADTSPVDRIEVETSVVVGVDGLIAQCPCERRELIEEYGASADRVTLIPSAVDINHFTPVDRATARRTVGLELDDLVIGYVGRMLPRKDVRNILRGAAIAARYLPRRPVVMIVGGDSADADPAVTPEIGELRRLASSLGISDMVRFYGNRQPSELAAYYSAADVMVTTPWYEPFGLTPLEAMACGRPVIGSRVGGIAYTVVDGETGFLVPPRHPDMLADRLVTLLSSPQVAEAMGRAARRRVEKEFVWSTTARRTLDLYGTVLGAGEQAVAGTRPTAGSAVATLGGA